MPSICLTALSSWSTVDGRRGALGVLVHVRDQGLGAADLAVDRADGQRELFCRCGDVGNVARTLLRGRGDGRDLVVGDVRDVFEVACLRLQGANIVDHLVNCRQELRVEPFDHVLEADAALGIVRRDRLGHGRLLQK